MAVTTAPSIRPSAARMGEAELEVHLLPAGTSQTMIEPTTVSPRRARAEGTSSGDRGRPSAVRGLSDGARSVSVNPSTSGPYPVASRAAGFIRTIRPSGS